MNKWLLGSNSRANLKEISTIKAEKNDEFWTKFMSGQPIPKPKTTFATERFFDYLKGAGVNVKHENGQITASPLTDHQIMDMSHGEIHDASMIDSKDLTPEKGGLFDPFVTGGLKGTRWSHYSLAEPVVNPTFENPIRHILGLTKNEFNGVATGKIGVKKVEGNKFHLHDLSTGKLIKEVKIGHSVADDKDVEEEDEED